MPTADLGSIERTLRSLDKTRGAAEASERLPRTARTLAADGKGILAADESNGTAGKRLESIGVEPDAEQRRAYRQLLFTAPGLEDHISGVILYDETTRQSTDDGVPFPRALADRGMIPGIKLDTGTKPLAGHPGEQITSGLDGARERLAAYVDAGVGFAKWRAVIRIAEGLPTRGCIEANMHAMARYAALCQEFGVVPVVEPEILMDGDHGMARDEEVTTATLQELYRQLVAQRVLLEGTVLKVNMILPGTESTQTPSEDEVAEATVRCLRRCVPAAVPAVAFLSGGQSALDATVRLDAINRTGAQPWKLTFSYARALQEPVLEAWRGEPANVADAQRRLVHRARCNGAAATGTYKAEMEGER